MAKKKRTVATFRTDLLDAIGKVDRPGAVCTFGDLPFTMPGLTVDGEGLVGLPLTRTQARKLIKHCVQAPYGKGTETLVNTDVRRVWELDPEHFELKNPDWDQQIASITRMVQSALGLEERKLNAHLYKLLLYEKGSFFLPHRDGEKLDGMVATLVVALPSPHTGGELVITHEGRRHTIPFEGAASGFSLTYAAFYADCEHEVLPVEDGYRLSLVYNLTLARSRKVIGAPQTRQAVAPIRQLFREWPSQDQLSKAAIILDHHYSEDGLNIDTLKGVDRARADVLFEAAEQAGCVAHLALITHWESGSAEGGDYGDYYGRGRHRRWSYDDEDEPEDATGYEMGEIYDEYLKVDCWSDREGTSTDFGEMSLEHDEIVTEGSLDDWEVTQEDFEGFTGNAGMTLERWYRRAAVVVWPQANHFRVLCQAGTDASIVGLGVMVKTWKRARKSDREQQRTDCLNFASAILESWSPRRRRFGYESYGTVDDSNRSTFPQMLVDLDEPDAVRRLLSDVMPNDGAVELGKAFARFAQQQGWRFFEKELTTLLKASSQQTLVRNAVLLEALCVHPAKGDDAAEQVDVCGRLSAVIVAALTDFDSQVPEHSWQRPHVDRPTLLASLIKALVSCGAADSLAKLIRHIQSNETTYSFTDVQLPALRQLEAWFAKTLDRSEPALTRWLKDCRTELERRTAEAPQPPADFRRPHEWSCGCKDCKELSKFLTDPQESVLRFPLAQGRRQHLHQVIDRNQLDLTHITERKGRPYTLVCTKTTGSFERAKEVYTRDLDHLKRIRTIEESLKSR